MTTLSNTTLKDKVVDNECHYFTCYLNGVFYGIGDKEYMLELMRDYVVDSDMYSKKTVQFKIVRGIPEQV